MSPPVSRAMILAAGLGTRMRPLTSDRPKALVTVAGQKLIDHAIARLTRAGVRRIVVNVHAFADMLIEHLAPRRDVEIIISDERGQLLDTGGGVVRALPYFEGEPFFTFNCDSLWAEGLSSSLARMQRMFDAARMDALLLLAPTVRALGFEGRGDFDMGPDGALSRREEARVSAFVWTGVQIIHPRAFAEAPAGPFSTNLVLDRLIGEGRLHGLRLDGTWMHVGTPASVAEAEAFLADLKLAG